MSNPDPDLIWVERCATGDERAMSYLVERYQGLVFGLSRRYLGNAEDAEEVAMSTFLKLWKSAAGFRGDCSVRAHLCRIALNICRDRPKPRPLPLPCPAPEKSPQMERILAALTHLPSDDREIIVLYYLDELSYDEICQTTGLEYDTLKTRLVRARKRLRTLLELHNE